MIFKPTLDEGQNVRLFFDYGDKKTLDETWSADFGNLPTYELQYAERYSVYNVRVWSFNNPSYVEKQFDVCYYIPPVIGNISVSIIMIKIMILITTMMMMMMMIIIIIISEQQ